MSGRFRTCEYPYCHKPALAVLSPRMLACGHLVCEDHLKHDCKEVDAWLKEGPKFNAFSPQEIEGGLLEEPQYQEPLPPKRPKQEDWKKIIDR